MLEFDRSTPVRPPAPPDDPDRPSEHSDFPPNEIRNYLADGLPTKSARDLMRALLGACAIAKRSPRIESGLHVISFHRDTDLAENFLRSATQVIAAQDRTSPHAPTPRSIAEQIWQNFESAPARTHDWYARWAEESVVGNRPFDAWPGDAKYAALQLSRGEGTSFSHIQLSDVSLDGAKLANVRITGSTITWVSAQGADFAKSQLCNNNWCKVSFAPLRMGSGELPADFRGADLSYSSLDLVSFKGAQLQGASLWMLNNLNVDFTGADLEEARITLDPDAFLRLPHCGIGEPLSGSSHAPGILHSIASIDPRHEAIKRDLMRQFIDIVLSSGCVESLVWDHVDLWMQTLEDPVYWADQAVTAFIDDYLPMGALPKWNGTVMPHTLNDRQLAFYITYLLEISSEPDWVTTCQGAIHQVVLQARDCPALEAFANALSRAFCAHEDVAPVVAALEGIFPGLADDTCIFVGRDNLDAVACERTLLRSVMHHEPSPEWGRVYHLTREHPMRPFVVQPNAGAFQTLLPSRLLHRAYADTSNDQQRLCGALLDALLPRPAAATVNAHETFRTMAASGFALFPSPRPDLTADEWQMALADMFNPSFAAPSPGSPASSSLHRQMADIRLTPEVRQSVLSTLGHAMPVLAARPQGASAMLLVEALKYVRLSSSLALGSETTSPLSLRQMACALINEALAAAQSGTLLDEGVANDWRNVLTGNTTELASCTAMLTETIIAYVQQPDAPGLLASAYDALFPYDWR